MSHGHGHIQRALLAILRKHERSPSARDVATGLDTVDLAHRVYQVKRTEHFTLLTKSKTVAVRRALARLAAEGLVVGLGTLYGGHECYWRINAANQTAGKARKLPRSKPPLPPLPAVDEPSPETMWLFEINTLAAEIAALEASWSRQFGEAWKTFKVPPDVVPLLKEADKAWAKLMARTRAI